MGVTETDGVDVIVNCVAQRPLLSLFFRLCSILCSKGHSSHVSNSGLEEEPEVSVTQPLLCLL